MLVIILLAVVVTVVSSTTQQAYNISGFGADADFSVHTTVSVGSEALFRAAITSYRKIIFEPDAGKFVLNTPIAINNITHLIIQGPIDLLMNGLYFKNCSNILVSNVRIFNASVYGILVYNSTNVVIDSATILDASRTTIDEGKCIDITEQSSNVTVSRSLFGYTYDISLLQKYKCILIANFNLGPVTNVSLHHNVFYCCYQRSPEISTPGVFDVVNNVVFNYTQYGTRVRNDARGNFEGNSYIGGNKDPLVFEGALQLHSVYNLWKKNCTNWQYIDDSITHDRFQVPTVPKDKFADAVAVVSGCGCRLPTALETAIKKNVLLHAQ